MEGMSVEAETERRREAAAEEEEEQRVEGGVGQIV